MLRSTALIAAFVCAIVAGCARSAPAPPTPPTVTKSGPGPLLESAALSARELAQILNIETFTFAYSGGRARCWLEIVETGQKTFDRQDIVHLNAQAEKGDEEAERGRFVLWLPRDTPGTIGLRWFCGLGEGAATASLRKDALWWGWKNPIIKTEWPNPHSPALGEPVTLLRHTAVEHKDSALDPKNPRTVTLTLKAEFPKED